MVYDKIELELELELEACESRSCRGLLMNVLRGVSKYSVDRSNLGVKCLLLMELKLKPLDAVAILGDSSIAESRAKIRGLEQVVWRLVVVGVQWHLMIMDCSGAGK